MYECMYACMSENDKITLLPRFNSQDFAHPSSEPLRLNRPGIINIST